MNHDLPPLRLPSPQIFDRRGESRLVPLPAERVGARAATAERLRLMVEAINDQLAEMDENARQQVLLRVEHERPLNLSGTGLKPFGPPSQNVTLAVLKKQEADLGRLQKKISDFGSGPLDARTQQPKNKELDAVQSVVRAQATDRLSDGLFAQYPTLIKRSDQFIIEIEITTMLTGPKQRRTELAAILQDINAALGFGVHGNLFEHDEIGDTCRVVMRCTGPTLKKLVEDAKWLTKISWFDERPRFQTFKEVKESFQASNLGKFTPPPADAPVVCVVDSGVSPKNPFLKPVVKTGLLKSFIKADLKNPYDGFGHGSGVASLVAYNGINIAAGATNEGRVWVASAKIITDNDCLEEDRLFSKVLAEVVEHFRPLGVRIFNLSVGNDMLKWNQESSRTANRKSWVARAIDHLSQKHDAIFVTCTGNILAPEINSYVSAGRPYPDYFTDPGASILDPGQAALALTVGSIAPGTKVATSSPDTAVATAHLPSPFTRSGPGIKREIKPELVEFGGNYAKDASNRVRAAAGLHVVMASHQETPAVAYNCGTSFAAPRVAHKLARVLHDLTAEQVKPSNALLKAFLVNSAMHRSPRDEHDEFVESIEAHAPGHWLNILGYGQPDDGRATDCDAHSFLLFFEGNIERNKIAFFDVPITAKLATSKPGKKRLTVTLVSTPEVQKTGLHSYLGTTTKWRMFRGDITQNEVITAMSKEPEDQPSDDEDEGNDPKELKFELGVMKRSRGVIQHDWFEWTQHKTEYSTNPYTLAIAGYERWGRAEGRSPPLPIAVVVRLEDLSRSVQVYTEAKVALQKPRIKTKR